MALEELSAMEVTFELIMVIEWEMKNGNNSGKWREFSLKFEVEKITREK
jgi:hypothetical protein